MPAGADPELALRLAKQLVDLYAQAEADLIATVARRVARGIDQPGWAERKLAETSALRAEAEARLAQLQTDLEPTIRDLVTRAHTAGQATADDDLATAGIDIGFGHTNTATVDTYVQQAVTNLQGTHLRIFRSTMDAYRDAVVEDVGQVVSGTATRRQVSQRVLDRFARQGITGFVDNAGRNWQLDTYAEMTARTAAGRAQVQGSLDRYQAAGRDLVIVSDAPEECPVCRPWEGKVLSISGRTPTGTKDGAIAVSGTVAEAVSAGLQHANCRHRLGLYIPGLTRPMHGTADPAGSEIRQEQRMLEREKRKLRRLQEAALDDETRRSYQDGIRALDRQLKLITDDRHAYARRRAEFWREGPASSHPKAKANAARWDRVADQIPAGTRGKRLRYRERVGSAH